MLSMGVLSDLAILKSQKSIFYLLLKITDFLIGCRCKLGSGKHNACEAKRPLGVHALSSDVSHTPDT